VAFADPAPEHDVADSRKGGDLGHRSHGTNTERIAVGVSKGVTATDRQHPNAGVHRVSRHDAKDVAAGPNFTQHIAGSAIFGAEYSHLAA
jgi:hypothetical protein